MSDPVMVETPVEQEVVTQIGDSLVNALEPPEVESAKVEEKEVEVKSDVKTEEESNTEPKVDPDLELRALLRSQSRELALLKAQVERHDKVQKGAIGDNEPELAEVEKLQQAIGELAVKRGDFFDELLETMELNPKFEDVRTVCSQANVDFIVDAAAKRIQETQGGDRTIITLQLEHEIWSQKNPYKYIYGLVKQHHPNFKVVEKEQDELTKIITKEPVKVAGSLATMGGSDADTKGSGWTAAKIDNLGEMELGQVPPDIYEKYLMNLLP